MKKASFINFIVILLMLFVMSLGYRGLMTEHNKKGTEQAEQGNAEAQYNIGVRYRFGIVGVPKDSSKAIEWFTKAAEQGNVEAQESLGSMYSDGEGVPQDYAKAAEWYAKAAEQGSDYAQYQLGYRYHRGEGVPKDYAKAAEWYAKAAEQVGEGSGHAQLSLGGMYYYGEGVPKDYAKAAAWYAKAAEKKNYLAQFDILGMIGEWFVKAHASRVAMAQFYLGRMYYKGEGVTRDIQKGCALMQAASKQDKDFIEDYNKYCAQDRQ